jgi:hypothetical protein
MDISRKLVEKWLSLDQKSFNGIMFFKRTEVIQEVLISYYKKYNIDYNRTSFGEDDEAIYQLFLTDQMPDKYVQEILEFSISNL